MVGSGSTFCKAGLSEAFISTVGATCMAFATPWNKLSWTTRMFSSFPRIRTHLENKKHRARELYVYITLYVTLSHLISLVCILQLKYSFTSLKHYFITKQLWFSLHLHLWAYLLVSTLMTLMPSMVPYRTKWPVSSKMMFASRIPSTFSSSLSTAIRLPNSMSGSCCLICCSSVNI